MIYLKRCTIIQWYTTLTWTWFIRFYGILIGYFFLSSEWLKIQSSWVLYILQSVPQIQPDENFYESSRILFLIIFIIGILINSLAATASSCNSSCMLTGIQWPTSELKRTFLLAVCDPWTMANGSLQAEMFQIKLILSLRGLSNGVIELMVVE